MECCDACSGGAVDGLLNRALFPLFRTTQRFILRLNDVDTPVVSEVKVFVGSSDSFRDGEVTRMDFVPPDVDDP
jgi:hypothetical protein